MKIAIALLAIIHYRSVVAFQYVFKPSLWAYRTSPLPTKKVSLPPSAFLASRIEPPTSTEDPYNHTTTTTPAGTDFLDMSLSFIGSTTSIAVSLTFFGVLAWKRDALMVTFFIGSIFNGILSKVLKKMINQTRPVELASESTLQRKPTDNGMPSSHAMSLGFIATFTTLCLPSTTIPLGVYTLVSLYYRIKVNLHTWQQVLVGLTVGSTNGFLWHWTCQTTTLMDWVRETFLGADGLLPIPLLIGPMVIGSMTVGSLERRLGDLMWWRKRPLEKTSDKDH